MEVQRVSRLVINCTDLERSIRWYSLLGFKADPPLPIQSGITAALGIPGAVGRSALLRLLGVVQLELQEWLTPEKTEQGQYPIMRHAGVSRFAMLTADLDGDLERLREEGITPTAGPIYTKTTADDNKLFVCGLLDPDGTPVTFAHANLDGQWAPRRMLNPPLPRLIAKPGQPQAFKVFHCNPVISSIKGTINFYRDAFGFRIEKDCGTTEPGTPAGYPGGEGPGNQPIGQLLGMPGASAHCCILNVGSVPKNPMQAGILLDMCEYIDPFPTVGRAWASPRKVGISRIVMQTDNVNAVMQQASERAGAQAVGEMALLNNGDAVACLRDLDGIFVQIEATAKPAIDAKL